LGVHYSMGGAWVDWPAADDPDRWTRFRHMTNIPGCFNVGESDFAYHGANRLGANSLLSCIFGGLVTGVEVPRYLETLEKTYSQLSAKLYSEAVAQEEGFKLELLERNGKENVFKLHDELAEIMVRDVTVVRNNKDLKKAMHEIKKIRERFQHISLDDTGSILNQSLIFAMQFDAMIELALVMTKGALLRDEFRGSHYKPEFPKRDDKHWLKTTIAQYDPDEPEISYRPVDTRHLAPILREYAQAKKVKPTLENVPDNIPLPI
jgi:succinate dehydrogenase / fumarate reductase, flavoprotein subunit